MTSPKPSPLSHLHTNSQRKKVIGAKNHQTMPTCTHSNLLIFGAFFCFNAQCCFEYLCKLFQKLCCICVVRDTRTYVQEYSLQSHVCSAIKLRCRANQSKGVKGLPQPPSPTPPQLPRWPQTAPVETTARDQVIDIYLGFDFVQMFWVSFNKLQ